MAASARYWQTGGAAAKAVASQARRSVTELTGLQQSAAEELRFRQQAAAHLRLCSATAAPIRNAKSKVGHLRVMSLFR